MDERLVTYYTKLQAIVTKLETNLQKEKEELGDSLKLSGEDFEDRVCTALIDEGIEKKNIYHSKRKFPDFVITDPDTGLKLGVEVKKSNEKNWKITGGSIYESLKNDIQETYVIMAKMGGDKPEVRMRKYEECIADLKVTHSPRVQLDLELEDGKDYLSLGDAKDLLELDGVELDRKIRELLRTEGSSWWSEEETILFNNLNPEERNMYLNDGLALFPEIFGSAKSAYFNFTQWLMYSCNLCCGNVRDIFSSGGISKIDEKEIFVSAVMKRAVDNIPSILKRIEKMSDADIVRFWKVKNVTGIVREDVWIEKVSINLTVSEQVIKRNQKLDKFMGMTKDEIEQEILRCYIELLIEKIEESKCDEDTK